MRRVGIIVTALGLLVALVATAGDLPVHAAMTQHVMLTNTMGPILSQAAIAPGDEPTHALVQVVRIDTITSAQPDFKGSQLLVSQQLDDRAGSGSHRGYGRQLFPTGEEAFGRFEGTHTLMATANCCSCRCCMPSSCSTSSS